jgi:hypothetical protein
MHAHTYSQSITAETRSRNEFDYSVHVWRSHAVLTSHPIACTHILTTAETRSRNEFDYSVHVWRNAHPDFINNTGAHSEAVGTEVEARALIEYERAKAAATATRARVSARREGRRSGRSAAAAAAVAAVTKARAIGADAAYIGALEKAATRAAAAVDEDEYSGDDDNDDMPGEPFAVAQRLMQTVSYLPPAR